MSTSNEMEAFLVEGLGRYSAAREAVDVFEREIQDRLVRRLEEQEWRNFQPMRGERGRGKALSVGVSGDDGGRIWATQASATQGDGWMQLELWWGSERNREGVVVACTRYDENGKVTRGLHPSDVKTPMALGKVGGKQRLYASTAASDGSLDELMRQVLDEMDRLLGLGPAR